MNTVMPTTGDVYFIVGYDGSAPATRALDAAAALLRGRDGSINVVYVPHMPPLDMLSPEAAAEMTVTFDQIAQDLQIQAGNQLRGREERWRFERSQGMITNIADALIGAAKQTRDAHPGDNVVIVIGASSQAMHRVVGSVAVSLARHAPVPILVVP